MKTRSTTNRTKKPARRKAVKPPPIEMYSDERVAEFLLTNTVDAEDYERACKNVRDLGLDPSKIDHVKPPGVK